MLLRFAVTERGCREGACWRLRRSSRRARAASRGSILSRPGAAASASSASPPGVGVRWGSWGRAGDGAEPSALLSAAPEAPLAAGAGAAGGLAASSSAA